MLSITLSSATSSVSGTGPVSSRTRCRCTRIHRYAWSKFTLNEQSTRQQRYFQTGPRSYISLTPAFFSIYVSSPRYGKPTKTELTKKNGFKTSELTFGTIYGKESLPSQLTVTGITARMALKALTRLIGSSKAGDYNNNNSTSSAGQEQQQQQQKPFSAALHFLAPHPPILSTNSYATYYTENQDKLFVSPSIKDPMKNSAYRNR